MSALFETLAIARNNLQCGSQRDYNRKVNVLEQLYDLGIDNAKNPGKLPKKFYLRNVVLSKEELESFLSGIGIQCDITNVNSGGIYGDMYQVDLKN